MLGSLSAQVRYPAFSVFTQASILTPDFVAIETR